MSCGDKVSDTCGGKKHYATCIKYEGKIGEHSELIDCDCHTVEEVIEDLYTMVDFLHEQIDTSDFLGDGCITYPEDPTIREVLEIHDQALKDIAQKVGLCAPDCPECTPSNTDCSGTETCCPLEVTITLNRAQVHSLHTTPIIAIIPPLGKGVRLAAPALMTTNMDGGQFQMETPDLIIIRNDALSSEVLGTFDTFYVVQNGKYSGSFFHTYQITRNGETLIDSSVTDGRVYIIAQSPITDGGPNATLTFKLIYQLES